MLQVVTAAAFLMAGFAKMSGHPMMVETFNHVGIGQWFRYVTGLIEVASAILLLIPRLTPIGAALLTCTMIGAVFAHLTVLGGSPLPAFVLLCFSAIIFWGRFETLKQRRLKLFALARAQGRQTAMSPERRVAALNGRANVSASSNALPSNRRSAVNDSEATQVNG